MGHAQSDLRILADITQKLIDHRDEFRPLTEAVIQIPFFKDKMHLAPINGPPYYAFKGTLGTNGAFGGVRVNPEMQAYKSDRVNLVEGLYVTGDFASGRHVNVRGVKWQVINDLSWAFSSGFLAGTNVAKYLENLG